MKKKKKFSKTTVVGSSLVIVVAITVLVGIIIFVNNDETIVGFDRDKILERALFNTNACSDFKMTMSVNRVRKGEDLNAVYMIAGNKSTSHRSYSYSDGTGEDNEFWYYDEITGQYCIYIYSTEVGSWVKCYYGQEPMQTDPWKVLADMDGYDLLEEYGVFSEKQCYVFQMVGTSDEFPIVYDRVYVSVDDCTLIGALRMGISDESYKTTDEVNVDVDKYIEGIEQSGNKVDSVESYQEVNDQVIIRFDYVFGNENLKFIEEPRVYITEDEYLYLMESGG